MHRVRVHEPREREPPITKQDRALRRLEKALSAVADQMNPLVLLHHVEDGVDSCVAIRETRDVVREVVRYLCRLLGRAGEWILPRRSRLRHDEDPRARVLAGVIRGLARLSVWFDLGR
jgi:hypothetical protein